MAQARAAKLIWEAQSGRSVDALRADYDEATFAQAGQMIIDSIGYDEIIKRGVEVGFLRYPEQKTNPHNFVGQTMAADAANQAWPVFTKGAMAAGIMALLDSPAPGPADVAAIGMLVVALASAGYVGVKVLTSSATATATPVRPPSPTTTTAPPIATPTTTTTAPPSPISGPTTRYPNQTCANAELDGLEAAKKTLCSLVGGFAAKCTGNVDKSKKTPCSAIKLSLVQRRACIAARWAVQNKCFGGKPDDRHKGEIDNVQNGIDNCEALELLNCANGHPQAGL